MLNSQFDAQNGSLNGVFEVLEYEYDCTDSFFFSFFFFLSEGLHFLTVSLAFAVYECMLLNAFPVSWFLRLPSHDFPSSYLLVSVCSSFLLGFQVPLASCIFLSLNPGFSFKHLSVSPIPVSGFLDSVAVSWFLDSVAIFRFSCYL